MAHLGNTQLIAIISAPPDQASEGDRIFRSHKTWMAATHHREGDKALLGYDMSKAPELSNPMDPSSSPTGNTAFILNEIYETDAGVGDHFQQAEASWEDFGAFMEWMGKCTVTMVPAAPIFNSLW